MKVGAINCDESVEFCDNFAVSRLPTIRIFTGNDSTRYDGKHTADGIVETGIAAQAKLIGSEEDYEEALDSNDNEEQSTEGTTTEEQTTELISTTENVEFTSIKEEESEEALYGLSDDVVELTLANFDSLVTKDADNVWLVKFYTSWCKFEHFVIDFLRQTSLKSFLIL